MYGGKQCDRIQKINQKHSNNQNRTASYVCLSNNPSHPGFQLLIVNLDSQFHQGRAHFYFFFSKTWRNKIKNWKEQKSTLERLSHHHLFTLFMSS